MNVRELMYAKKVQREFRSLFGKDLVIDFPLMNGIVEDKNPDVPLSLDTYLSHCMRKHNLTITEISTKLRPGNRKRSEVEERIRKCIAEYGMYAYENGFNLKKAASLINKDRKTLYYYAKGNLV